MRKLLEVMDVLITLVVVLVSRVDAYVQTHQILHIKHVQLFLFINYISVKLLNKMIPLFLFIFNTHTQIIIQKNTLLKQKILPFLRQSVIRPSPQDNIDQLRHHRGSCMLDTATWLL